MSDHAQADSGAELVGSDDQASVAEVSGVGEVESSAGASVVRAHDGQPVSDEMASAAAVAAVVAIRQVAIAYAAHQSAADDLSATTKHGRAGFNAPRRDVRGRLPMTWTDRA